MAEEAGLELAPLVAREAQETAQLRVGSEVRVAVLVVDRRGAIVGESS
jgi:hypothetical protein